MISAGSVCWDKKQKAWVTIIGSYPLMDAYDAEARHFQVQALVYVEGFKEKALAKNLQLLNEGDWVEVDSGYFRDDIELSTITLQVNRATSKWVEVSEGASLPSKEWRSVRQPAPVDYVPPQFKRGDLVHLVFEGSYWAIVSGDDGQTPPRTYTVTYFHELEYDHYLEKGLTAASNNEYKCAAQRLRAITDKPAPRLVRSASQRKAVRNAFKAKLNSGNYQKYWRYVYLGVDFPSTVENNKRKGKILRTVIQEAARDECETLRDNLHIVRDLLNGFVKEIRTPIWEKIESICECHDLLQLCPNCDEIEVYDNMMYSDWHDVSFCGGCEEDFVYSEPMETYIRRSEALHYYDSETSLYNRNPDSFVIDEWARAQSDCFVYDGYWVDEDTFRAATERDDDYDDSDNGRDGLNGYHSTYRQWKQEWEDKSYLPLGLEIEVHTYERADAVSAMKNAFSNLVYLEEDGSLDDDHGFEVITQPLGKTEWAKYGKKMLNILKSNGCVAYNEPAGENYGIHININRKYLTPLQEMRMFMFLAADDNYEFVTAIAQRAHVYNADMHIGQTTKQNQRVRTLGGLDSVFTGRRNPAGKPVYMKKLIGKGKYAPVKLHDNRMEIRIFQSTLNGTSFNKNLEFTWALIEWTSVKASSGTSWLHRDFVTWLADRPHAETDYPNLMAFLRKDTYKRIDSDDVGNTWKDLIPKETRRSVPQAVVNLSNNELVEPVEVTVTVPAYQIPESPGTGASAVAA